MFKWNHKKKEKKESGGFIYGAYSGPILPPMIGISCPGKKWIVMLTRKNGFAITDGISVYGGKPRSYSGSDRNEIIDQIKEYLYNELREFCCEDNGVYKKYPIELWYDYKS